MDFATIAAAVFAGFGLWATSSAIRGQNKARDLESVLRFHETISTAERTIGKTNDWRNLHIYLNLLEVYAAAVNRGMLGKVAAGFAKERLINDIAIISVFASKEVGAALTSADTFSDLAKFNRGYREDIKCAIVRECKKISASADS